MRESDLYEPVKAFLESQGYEVKGEVVNCDVTAIRNDEAPVVVELKTSINISLLMQATDRLALTSKVYIGVPMTCPMLVRKRKAVTKLLRMLGLGLISVDTDVSGRQPYGATTVLIDPAPYRPRQQRYKTDRLLGEFEARVGDPVAGGSDRRRGLMTAYRQRAIRLAEHLADNGPIKASVLAKTLDEPKARNILYNNVYGWFEGHGRGVYGLSPRGQTELKEWS